MSSKHVFRGVASALAAVLLASSSMAALAAPGQGGSASSQDDTKWTEIWGDEFSGANGSAPDSSKWCYDTGNFIVDGSGNPVSQGWGNNELENYTSSTDNVYQQDGNLVIEAKKQATKDQFGNNLNYTSGKIKTLGKFSMKYGRVDIKAKLPEGNGLWPAFWMLPADNAYGPWPASGEVDMMENKGRLPGEVYGTLHYGGPNNHIFSGGTYTFPSGQSVSSDYHTYSIEWDPGEIRWYVDGNLYKTQSNWMCYDAYNQEKYSFAAPFDQNFYLIMNLAVGGNFDNIAVDDSKMPAKMMVDYVHAYRYNGTYAPVQEPVITPDPLPANAKQADATGNLISNGNFNSPIQENAEATADFGTNWNFVHISQFGGAGTAGTDSIAGTNYAKINVSNAGTQNYSVQLIQKTTVGKGRWYKVTFDAKADKSTTIHEKVGGGDEAGWAVFSKDNTFNLTDSFNTYTDTFQMQQNTDTQARLEFELGTGAPQSVWIGNVRLEEVQAPQTDYNASKTPLLNGNLVYNGAFDKGNANRLTYWNLSTANSATASYNVPEDTRDLHVDITGKGGTARDITIDQQGLQLENGGTYALSFSGSSDTPSQLEVLCESKDGKVIYTDQTVNLTVQKATSKLSFTMDKPADSNAKLVFAMGNGASHVTLDDVFLTKAASSDSNLIKNGEFSADTANWDNYFADGANGTVSTENGAMKIALKDKPGVYSYSAQVYQHGFKLENGKTYTLSFTAKADAARKMNINIGKALTSDPWFVPYADMRTVDLGTGYKQYTFSFIVTQSTYSDLKLVFEVGNVTGGNAVTNIYLDNIALREASTDAKADTLTVTEPDNLIHDGNFDDGVTLNQTNSFWQTWAGEGGSGSAAVVGGKLKYQVTSVGNQSWSVQLFQPNCTLTNGKKYFVSFTASSDTARKMNVNIGKPLSSDPYFTAYLNPGKVFDIDPTEKQFTFPFTVTEPTDSSIKLVFELGNVAGGNSPANVFIDNVSIRQIDEPVIVQKVVTPVITPASGSYDVAQSVTITCATSGAAIHFTTDGSEPNASSPTYSSPITVAQTQTIKAVAVKDGMTNSDTATADFVIVPKAVITVTDSDKKPVPSGGLTGKSVIVTTENAKSVSATKDGLGFSWPENNTFTQDGAYIVTLTGADAKALTYRFTIDKTAPVISVSTAAGAAIADGGSVSDPVYVKCSDANPADTTAAKDGAKIAWPADGSFKDSGKYTITSTDKLGNSSTFTFTITKASSSSNTGNSSSSAANPGSSSMASSGKSSSPAANPKTGETLPDPNRLCALVLAAAALLASTCGIITTRRKSLRK